MSDAVRPAHIMMIGHGYALIQSLRIELASRTMSICVVVG